MKHQESIWIIICQTRFSYVSIKNGLGFNNMEASLIFVFWMHLTYVSTKTYTRVVTKMTIVQKFSRYWYQRSADTRIRIRVRFNVRDRGFDAVGDPSPNSKKWVYPNPCPSHVRVRWSMIGTSRQEIKIFGVKNSPIDPQHLKLATNICRF